MKALNFTLESAGGALDSSESFCLHSTRGQGAAACPCVEEGFVGDTQEAGFRVPFTLSRVVRADLRVPLLQ